jgi:cell division septum initiation protein DivIVA
MNKNSRKGEKCKVKTKENEENKKLKEKINKLEKKLEEYKSEKNICWYTYN